MASASALRIGSTFRTDLVINAGMVMSYGGGILSSFGP
jgi:hypothetical protein